MTSATTLGYVLRLRDQGWRGLLPILPADAKPAPWLSPDEKEAVLRGRGKAPARHEGKGYWSLLKGWRTYPDDEATLERWASWPGVNVGLRACHDGSEIVGLDLDILDPETALEIGRLVRDFLHRHTGCGLGVAFRVGLWPKILIPILVRGTVRKTSGQAYEINGQKCAVEVLGEGSQFLIRGRHPTGADYRWPLDGPEDIDPASLPSLSATELAELLEKINADLRKRGAPVGRARATVRTGTSAPNDLEELRAWDREEALSAAHALKNDDLEYHEWIQRAYALRGALGDEGKELWLAFSRNSRKHREGEARGVWRSVTQAEERGQLRSGVSALYELAEADGWEAPPHPAQPLIYKIKAKHRAEVQAHAQARKDADGEPETDIGKGAEREEEGAQEAPRSRFEGCPYDDDDDASEEPGAGSELPPFESVSADRDGTISAMQEKITEVVLAAVARIGIRADRERDIEHAKLEVLTAYEEELGKCREQMDDREKRRLSRRKGKAAKAIRKRYEAEHGSLEPEAHLFHGITGGGKTRTIAKGLASIEQGSYRVLVPTVVKADELKEEIEKHNPHLQVFVWRGRTHDYKDPDALSRLCKEDKEIINLAHGQGIDVYEYICKKCPFYDSCAYLEQMQEVKDADGARIVIAARETLFLGHECFAADLVIMDEEVPSLFTREDVIDPTPHPDLWAEHPEEAETAQKIAVAMQSYGGELAALREVGIGDKALRACEVALEANHAKVLGEIEVALREGRRGYARDRLRELRGRGYLRWIGFFRNLRKELKTARDGTNATRLVFREQTVKEKDGSENRVRSAKYVVNRKRDHALKEGTELVLLDGTGSPDLNRLIFGEEVQAHRYAVERQGQAVQLSYGTCSKYNLLRKEGADRNRAKIARLVRALASIYGDKLMVGSTMEVERTLEAEGTLEGIRHLHFGEERGLNSAEDCEVALVIGREQPSVAVIEGMARSFTVEDERQFQSVLDQNEHGELPVFRRRRRMRDGSEAWGEVRSHPDPLARAFLEQIRESAIIQMADRVRAVWNPKTIMVVTDLPIDLTIGQLMTRAELVSAAERAAGIVAGLRTKGWALRPNWVSGSDFRNNILLTVLAAAHPIPAYLPTGNGWGTALELWTTLPPAEAFRLAAVDHPGIRPATPEGGVLGECMRRFGLVPAWREVQVLLPEFLPDAAALKAAEDAGREELKRLRETLPSVRYRVRGKRGRASVAVYDPSRVPDISRALVALLGDGVTIEQPPETRAAPDFMDPNSWAPPAQSVIFDDGEPPPFGFRGGPVRPSAYVIAGLFKIGDRLVADVIRQPPPPSVQEAAA